MYMLVNNQMAGEKLPNPKWNDSHQINFYVSINNASFQLLKNQIPVKIAVFFKKQVGLIKTWRARSGWKAFQACFYKS